jgi:hypothetical protein
LTSSYNNVDLGETKKSEAHELTDVSLSDEHLLHTEGWILSLCMSRSRKPNQLLILREFFSFFSMGNLSGLFLSANRHRSLISSDAHSFKRLHYEGSQRTRIHGYMEPMEGRALDFIRVNNKDALLRGTEGRAKHQQEARAMQLSERLWKAHKHCFDMKGDIDR